MGRGMTGSMRKRTLHIWSSLCSGSSTNALFWYLLWCLSWLCPDLQRKAWAAVFLSVETQVCLWFAQSVSSCGFKLVVGHLSVTRSFGDSSEPLSVGVNDMQGNALVGPTEEGQHWVSLFLLSNCWFDLSCIHVVLSFDNVVPEDVWSRELICFAYVVLCRIWQLVPITQFLLSPGCLFSQWHEFGGNRTVWHFWNPVVIWTNEYVRWLLPYHYRVPPRVVALLNVKRGNATTCTHLFVLSYWYWDEEELSWLLLKSQWHEPACKSRWWSLQTPF